MNHSERIESIRKRLNYEKTGLICDSWSSGYAELTVNAAADLDYLLNALGVAVETIKFEINDCPVGEGCSDPRCKRLKLALQKIEGGMK